MIHSETRSSGTSSLPPVLAYPRPLQLAVALPTLNNMMCYVVEHYGHAGLSVLLYREIQTGNSYYIFGDWNRNRIDIEVGDGPPHPLISFISEFVKSYSVSLLELLSLIKLPQAQFYFATVGDELTLVDVQLSLNKWAGPGMIKEVFGKLLKTQTIKKVEVLDERAIDAITRGVGNYAGDLILKPSRFRQYHNQETKAYQPFYVEIVR